MADTAVPTGRLLGDGPMKYMGSKRAMLENGLGDLIKSQARNANRIIDPFCGSGVVAWYAAEHTDRQVIATDLQEYAVVLARAVLLRTMTLEAEELAGEWFDQARKLMELWPYYREALRHEQENLESDPEERVARARVLCARSVDGGPIWRAYGGHYFSPLQALTFDSLRSTLPSEEPYQSVALAAVVSAASACAASPGHTAQPFQPTAKASTYLFEAWRRDPFHYCLKALQDTCPRHAQVVGEAYMRDALHLACSVRKGDLVIIDPPYSSVHYSRFYHVLETVARGKCGPVEGVGRYPPRHERSQSLFSLKTRSEVALRALLERLSVRRVSAILTFPAGRSSNGLTGEMVVSIAREHFKVEKQTIDGRFSTLGGNSQHRPARQESRELMLLLLPKSRP